MHKSALHKQFRIAEAASKGLTEMSLSERTDSMASHFLDNLSQFWQRPGIRRFGVLIYKMESDTWSR